MVQYRELAFQRQSRGEESLSSSQMAGFLGEDPALVRKDLQGLDLETPGRSYRLESLVSGLNGVLTTSLAWTVVGLGDLGLHLLRRMQGAGYNVRAVFDAKPNRLDQLDLDLPAYPAYEIPQRVESLGIEVAVLAVPAAAVGVSVDRLVEGGIRGIVNFSRGLVRQGHGVVVINAGFELHLGLMGALLKENQKGENHETSL